MIGEGDHNHKTNAFSKLHALRLQYFYLYFLILVDINAIFGLKNPIMQFSKFHNFKVRFIVYSFYTHLNYKKKIKVIMTFLKFIKIINIRCYLKNYK